MKKPKRICRQHRDVLAPFAAPIYDMHRHILMMDDAQTRTLLRACRSVSDTNCGWAEYEAAKLVEEHVKIQMAQRARLRRRKRRQSATLGKEG